MPVKWKKIIDNHQKFVEGLNDLVETRVLAGVPAQKTTREETEGQPINNATLAYIHDNGAPEVNIPARPFMHPGMESIKGQIAPMLKKAAGLALEGNPDGMRRQLSALGILCQNAIRKKITDGPFVPLSPRTLAARKARKRSGTKPLIDTGQLRRSITYVLRKGKENLKVGG